tara:strand:- start:257 stop:859 length:603 start_codon:yes stop_codon:yes gene_type:complete
MFYDPFQKHLDVRNAIHEYYIFENALNDRECQNFLDFAGNEWQDSIITSFANGKDTTKLYPKDSVRKSKIVWCNEIKLLKIAKHYADRANSITNWQFQLDMVEPLQITKYEKNGHYDFHSDGNGFSRTVNNEKTRKLSMSIILNDDYEGGEFEFYGHKKSIKPTKGTVIVFPSYMVHRVKPVTKGIRYSVVAWFCGEPFR